MPVKTAPQKTLNTIGDGDVLIFERQIGAIDFVPGQQRKYDVKQQPNLIKRMMLHVEVTAVIASPVGPVTWINPADAPFNMISNIQVRTSQGLVLKNFSALQIELLNRLEFFTPSLNTAPATFPTGATYVFAFDVILPFENHTGILPERTILNTNQYNDLTVFVTWEALANVFGGTYDPLLDTITASCSVISCERPPVDRNDELMSRQQMIDTIANGAFNIGSFILPENTMIKTLMNIARDSAGLRSNTAQDILTVSYDSGNYVLRNMTYSQIQSQNKSYYHVEAIDAGVAVYEFDQTRDFKTLFRTKNRNYARIEYTGNIPVDGTIELFRRRIATPKVITL